MQLGEGHLKQNQCQKRQGPQGHQLDRGAPSRHETLPKQYRGPRAGACSRSGTQPLGAALRGCTGTCPAGQAGLSVQGRRAWKQREETVWTKTGRPQRSRKLAGGCGGHQGQAAGRGPAGPGWGQHWMPWLWECSSEPRGCLLLCHPSSLSALPAVTFGKSPSRTDLHHCSPHIGQCSPVPQIMASVRLLGWRRKWEGDACWRCWPACSLSPESPDPGLDILPERDSGPPAAPTGLPVSLAGSGGPEHGSARTGSVGCAGRRPGFWEQCGWRAA